MLRMCQSAKSHSQSVVQAVMTLPSFHYALQARQHTESAPVDSWQ